MKNHLGKDCPFELGFLVEYDTHEEIGVVISELDSADSVMVPQKHLRDLIHQLMEYERVLIKSVIANFEVSNGN